MNKFVGALLGIGLLLGTMSAVNAETFAQFNLDTGDGTYSPTPANPFKFTNDGLHTAGSGKYGLVATSTAFKFSWLAEAVPFGLNPTLVGDYHVVIKIIDSQTNGFGAVDFSNTIHQPLGDLKIEVVTADTAVPSGALQHGIAPGTVLFEVDAENPAASTGLDLHGNLNGSASSVSGDELGGVTIAYSSVYAPGLAVAIDKALNIEMTNTRPKLNVDNNPFPGVGIVNSFTASGTGTFDATSVPEPGVLQGLLGVAVTGSALLYRRRRA